MVKRGKMTILRRNENIRMEERQRTRNIVRKLAGIFAAGFLYAVWIAATGIYIPCLFRTLTGFQCPGCGISHCLMSLIRCDLKSALEANAFVLILIPAALPYAGYRILKYIRTGETDFTVPETVMLMAVMAAAVLFAVFRNQ